MKRVFLPAVFVVAVAAAVGITWLLTTVAVRKSEERLRYFKVTEVKPEEPDPGVWGRNFPAEYDAYMKTMRTADLIGYSTYGRYGGSEAFSRLDKYPDLKRLFAGYPFAVEYREDRGHMHALGDLLATKRLDDKKPGPCMTCKSSQVPGIMGRIGPGLFYATPVKELVALLKKRKTRIVMRKWPDRTDWMCNSCGRAVGKNGGCK